MRTDPHKANSRQVRLRKPSTAETSPAAPARCDPIGFLFEASRADLVRTAPAGRPRAGRDGPAERVGGSECIQSASSPPRLQRLAGGCRCHAVAVQDVPGGPTCRGWVATRGATPADDRTHAAVPRSADQHPAAGGLGCDAGFLWRSVAAETRRARATIGCVPCSGGRSSAGSGRTKARQRAQVCQEGLPAEHGPRGLGYRLGSNPRTKRASDRRALRS